MSRFCLWAALLALGVAAGCKAQTSTQAQIDSTLTRHIEVMVRSQFGVPQDYTVSVGTRKPSQIPGYDALLVTVSRGAKATVVDFLLSTDGTKLARLETFDLAKDPIFSIDVAGRPVRGNPDAKVTLINFDDLECPYCARLHQELFPRTLERYKDKVRFIYKDNPLADMHPWATHAAVDANCLNTQNTTAYWSYVDYLHSHGQEINGEDRSLPKSFAALDRIAREQGTLAKLDGGKLDACISKQDEAQVKASMKEAETLKIDSAPAAFVNGERVDGAVPEQKLWLVIDRALRAAGVEPPPPDAAAQPVSAAPAHAAGAGN